jgi:hypothetical protein
VKYKKILSRLIPLLDETHFTIMDRSFAILHNDRVFTNYSTL